MVITDDIEMRRRTQCIFDDGSSQESRILYHNNNTVISLVRILFVLSPCNSKMYCEKLKCDIVYCCTVSTIRILPFPLKRGIIFLKILFFFCPDCRPISVRQGRLECDDFLKNRASHLRQLPGEAAY